MLTTRAQRKLDEARFFLSRLSEEAGRNSEAFSYYLSAFLAAADSVFDVGRKEAKIKQREFESWKTTALDENERALVDFMTEQRNAEVHRQGTSTVVRVRASPVTFYPYVEPLPIDLVFKGSLDEGPAGPQGLPHWVRVWIPTPEHAFQTTTDQTTPVVGECNRFYALLRKFLKWAEARP